MPPQQQPTISFEGFFEEALQTNRLKLIADIALEEGQVAIDAATSQAVNASAAATKTFEDTGLDDIEPFFPPTFDEQPRLEWDDQRKVDAIN